MHHELNWKAPGHVISHGQDRLEPLPVLVVLTNDGPLPRLLQVTVRYWLKGDDAFTVLSGFPVDWRVYGCAIWTSYFKAKMSHGIDSNSIFCLTCNLRESRWVCEWVTSPCCRKQEINKRYRAVTMVIQGTWSRRLVIIRGQNVKSASLSQFDITTLWTPNPLYRYYYTWLYSNF